MGSFNHSMNNTISHHIIIETIMHAWIGNLLGNDYAEVVQSLPSEKNTPTRSSKNAFWKTWATFINLQMNFTHYAAGVLRKGKHSKSRKGLS